jgi:hypothetical protein
MTQNVYDTPSLAALSGKMGIALQKKAEYTLQREAFVREQLRQRRMQEEKEKYDALPECGIRWCKEKRAEDAEFCPVCSDNIKSWKR